MDLAKRNMVKAKSSLPGSQTPHLATGSQLQGAVQLQAIGSVQKMTHLRTYRKGTRLDRNLSLLWKGNGQLEGLGPTYSKPDSIYSRNMVATLSTPNQERVGSLYTNPSPKSSSSPSPQWRPAGHHSQSLDTGSLCNSAACSTKSAG
ncbi:hypothetical protein KIL84_021138 [Mauremys mutica]|uniref:Uncharacterized protein n=1 Tax=Mauremys mutica TaxID=74926 RepID=A0A9D3X9J3_9SAUR|nr:hypothetical protein KIL84_021138 [Mauremys mutica]